MPDKKPAQPESTVELRDLTPVLKDAPAGAWVALSHDKTRIAGTGTSISGAARQAQLNGEENPIMIKMPLEGEGIAAGVR